MLARLHTVFGAAAFERLPDGRFHLLNEAPGWVASLMPGLGAHNGVVSLHREFEFLDNFLIDAERLWERGFSGRLASGPWIEVDATQRQWPLEAHALVLDGNCILVLKHLGAEYAERQSATQAANVTLLSNELLEREVERRTADIRSREEEITERLLGAAGLRDEETGAHIHRIGLYSGAIAEALGQSQDFVSDIRIAAPMHDVGKIGIPDAVLLKPGRLTDAEFAVMKKHTEIGARLLESDDVPLLHMAREIALTHHEKWNGSGYPRRLAGDAIPLSGRIVALVDVYDALTHRRVYKDAWSESQALEYLRSEAGQHFDPELLEVFFNILPRLRQISASVPEEENESGASMRA